MVVRLFTNTTFSITIGKDFYNDMENLQKFNSSALLMSIDVELQGVCNEFFAGNLFSIFYSLSSNLKILWYETPTRQSINGGLKDIAEE